MEYALITGASQGIGKAMAGELARRGFPLLLVARSSDKLQQVAGEIRSRYQVKVDWLALDLSAADAPKKVVEWLTGKDYAVQALVNNAGYGLSGLFEEYPLEDHLNMMQLNMTTLVSLTRLMLPILARQSRAYILNTASTAAYQAVPRMSLYAATKAFVLVFSRGLHQELRGGPISVTCVSPGSTDTQFVERARIGAKGLKAAQRVNMTPEAVAAIAVKTMLAGRAEVITGVVNKLGAAMAWLLPKGLVERTAMKIYE
jgi:short-subunit dehydrogenase